MRIKLMNIGKRMLLSHKVQPVLWILYAEYTLWCYSVTKKGAKKIKLFLLIQLWNTYIHTSIRFIVNKCTPHPCLSLYLYVFTHLYSVKVTFKFDCGMHIILNIKMSLFVLPRLKVATNFKTSPVAIYY